ncbi:MAG TPA: tetratricopeptide repeat-containing glycosyltransferase family protein [Rhodocyclaceae bacterium]|nr:tetratricopeptide repeat-containing glycosyltransferase family protein [Rhodocyclaceae bacterium]
MFSFFIRRLFSRERTQRADDVVLHPEEGPADTQTRLENSIRELLDRAEHAHRRLDMKEAARCFQAALALKTDNANALKGLGEVLRKQGRHVEAELYLNLALDYAPTDRMATDSLLSLLIETRKLGQAEALLARLAPRSPDDPDLQLFAARIRVAREGASSAVPLYSRILEKAPDHARTKEFLGNTYARLGEVEKALEILSQVTTSHPDRALSRYYYSIHLLKAGRFREGLLHHESRLDLPGSRDTPYDLQLVFHTMKQAVRRIPPWQRDDRLSGKRLLIWREQGLGDCLMMLRFLSVVRAHNPAKISLLLDPSLILIAHEMGIADEIISIPTWNSTGQVERDDLFDLQCSFMSLPWLLDCALEATGSYVPYLQAPASSTWQWLEPLRSSTHPRVGLVWAGNPELAEDGARSLHFRALQPLFSLPDIQFVSLQYGHARQQIHDAGLDIPLIDLMDNCTSFAETAAVIQELDLIIAVDTAVVHLAGGLGKTVWMLNRSGSEWRWMLGRCDSPWYPAMQIFNQASDEDWATVIARVADALQSFVTSSSHAVPPTVRPSMRSVG